MKTLENVNVMNELKKSDCISVQNAIKELRITRNTLSSYMGVLGVGKKNFPLDRRVYITKADFERVKDLLAENRS